MEYQYAVHTKILSKVVLVIMENITNINTRIVTMNYSKSGGYDQVPPVLDQFKVQNIENLDFPIVTGELNGNVVQTRNIQPNIDARLPVQAESTISMQTETVDDGSISIANVSNGSHSAEVPNKGHVFEYHDPFDIHSYPITNPPIFDSTMILPYTSNEGIPRRRRISISNGQIGQIINHEFYLDNESLLDEDLNGPRLNDQPLSKDDTMLNDAHPHQNRAPVRPGSTEQFLQIQQPQMPQKDMIPQRPVKAALDIPLGQQQRMYRENQLKSEIHRTPKDPPAGVPPPNHQLIYNNEVIYNPNNGPIPGTAAWKKERLLERNRLAASKCRQRKKHAQQQLQNNVSKYQKDVDVLKDKLNKYEKVFKNYNLIISKHVDKFPDSDLKTLSKFSDIDAITEKDLDVISKLAGS